MSIIQQQLILVKQQIADCAQQCGRDPKSITLLAVSKTKPVSAIQEAIDAGQFQFGENYAQEGIEKIRYFAQHLPTTPLTWHFIGALQSNKCRLIAQHFDWVHTIDRLKIAQRLSTYRAEHATPLNVLLQINIDNEITKAGAAVTDLFTLAQQVVALPHLCLRGLMIIPAPSDDPAQQTAVCLQAAELFAQLQKRYLTVDTLSMGMSNDMLSAIKAGSTMVRIGSAIFGVRS